MREESTDVVLKKILNSNSLDEVSKITQTTEATFDKSFTDFFNEYLAKNTELVLSDIIKDSGIDKTYAYQMTNGKKTNPGRDYILALCYAARMNLDEVNHALIYSHNGQLHSKITRDANLIFAFSHNNKTKRVKVMDLNEKLSDRDIEPLKINKGSV